jgi:hypothetical protein
VLRNTPTIVLNLIHDAIYTKCQSANQAADNSTKASSNWPAYRCANNRSCSGSSSSAGTSGLGYITTRNTCARYLR